MKKIVYFCIAFFLLSGTLALSQTTNLFTDKRDGNEYLSVVIGDQVWMAENLAYLPSVDPVRNLSWSESRFWVYDYYGTSVEEAQETEMYKKYGVLYNWSAAVHDACPEGWRLPTEPDWQKLEAYAGMSQEQLNQRNWRGSGAAGDKLKLGLEWNGVKASDELGFNALPGGLMGYNAYESESFSGFFWVASATHPDNAWVRSLTVSEDGIKRIEERKWFGCSVRCIMDN